MNDTRPVSTKTPRRVGSNEARIDMAVILDDARAGVPTLITRNGHATAWVIPVTCTFCKVVIRSASPRATWWDLGGSDTCASGTRHEPDTPLFPQPERNDRA